MSRLLEFRTRLLRKEVLAPVCVFAMFGALSFSAAWSWADRSLYDLFLRIESSVAPLAKSPRIVSVDLTDRVELSLGSAVDTRRVFLDATAVLARAKALGGFDMLFAARKDPVIDGRIAKGFERSPGCTLVVEPLSKAETNFSGSAPAEWENAVIRRHLWHPKVANDGKVPVAERFLLPTREIAESTPHLAQAALRIDSDGICRRAPLLYKWEDGYMPSFALVLAAEALGIDPEETVLDAGSFLRMPLKKGGEIDIPIDESACAYIPYAGPWSDGARRIPLDAFAAAARDDGKYSEMYDLIDGNIVVFSDITTGQKDYGTTPLESVYPLSGIHYSMLNGIITGAFFRPIPPLARSLAFALLFACALGIILAKGEGRFHVAFVILFVAYGISTLLLWLTLLWVPEFSGMAFALFTAWLTSWIFRLLASHNERLLMKNALSRYFPRALAQRIIKEGKTDLIPGKKVLTILFADISGFTKWSSDKTPESVHEFLGDYLESMSRVLFEHGGTVDKFMGDGILAFFGDPYAQPDHAERCVRAALDMQRRIGILAGKWKRPAGIDLKVRIGINTGEVIVGNLGSDARIEYTVIGSAVNLAQRMESNAPVGGILVAEDAYARVADLFRFSEPQQIHAKGYERPVNGYVVLGESQASATSLEGRNT
jgi:adenylate cyclase